MISNKLLGSILLEEHVLTQEQLNELTSQQKQTGASLSSLVKRFGYASDEELLGITVRHSDYPFVRLQNLTLSQRWTRLLSKEHCLNLRAIPIGREKDVLVVAMADPSDLQAVDQIRALAGMDVLPVLANEDMILDATLRQHFDSSKSIQALAKEIGKKIKIDPNTVELARKAGLEKTGDETSPLIIQLSCRLVEGAYYQGASDIHVEPHDDVAIVRYRIDGELRDTLELPRHVAPSLVARFKVMADLDIAEHRLPQDGRINYMQFSQDNLDIDLRVSTIPVKYGEKVVMRILVKSSISVDIASLGYSQSIMDSYKKILRAPYGMILHVGPTGSGKTTSLYAALNFISNPVLNVQTVEDPIEYSLPRINQTQVKPEIGLTFACALRSFLRQDPDIILVGEIRDYETADIAIQAALTGHILFSTMHTNNAVGTILRFLELGVPPFLVSSALIGIVAQRLVRKLCSCKGVQPITLSEFELLGLSSPTEGEIARPVGCPRCFNTGYRGRIGVFEFLEMNDEVRHLINSKAPAEELHRCAVNHGMVPLFKDAAEKVLKQTTSLEEILCVVRD